MRYLIDGRVFTDPAPGGVTRVAGELVRAMMEVGQEATWTVGTTGVGAVGRMGDINITPTHRSIPNKLVALGTWTRLTSFDRLMPGTFDALFLPNLEMVGRPKIPYALLVHDLSFLIEPRWFIPKTQLWHKVARAKELIRRADSLLTVSERTKEDLVRLLGISSEKIWTIPLGSSYDSPPLLEAAPSSPYFLVLGGNDPRKNIACVMRAFEELQKTIGVRLVIVGASLKPVSTGVSFIRRPSDNALAELMKNAAALLYPSWYEGFGLPLHEAARHGTPIIASTAGALPETAPSGTIFVPPFKPHLWLQAMRASLVQPRSTVTPLPRDWSAAGRMVVDCLEKIAS